MFKAAELYLLDFKANYYEIESELLLKSLFFGFKIGGVPITIFKVVPGIIILDGLKLGLKLKLGALFVC